MKPMRSAQSERAVFSASRDNCQLRRTPSRNRRGLTNTNYYTGQRLLSGNETIGQSVYEPVVPIPEAPAH